MADSWIGAAASAAWPKLAKPRSLRPTATYAHAAPRAVLVLQNGPNASVDYYLRPRLETDPSRAWAVADLSTNASEVPLFHTEGLWVVICRYINSAWTEALKGARSRLSGVSFFVDDDLPAMMTEPGSPLEARLKVATRYARFANDLEVVTSEIWVSTPELAKRFDGPTRILSPVPFDDPSPPERDQAPLIVYHGTLTHDAERAFLYDVAKHLDEAQTPLQLEIAGGLRTRLRWAFRRKALICAQASWPDYLREQRRRRAAVLLAPLTDGLVNTARAPVKVFDAARLGAVGIYADGPTYSGAVTDGVDGRLLPMKPAAWAEATLQLLNDPDLRLRMSQAAYERVTTMRASPGGLFEVLSP